MAGSMEGMLGTLGQEIETFASDVLTGLFGESEENIRARADLAFFLEYTLVDQRGHPLKLQWFHKEMVRFLLFEQRILVLLPRTFGKSTIGSVGYPAWRLGTNRDLRIILASNTITQAKWWLGEIENLMMRNQRFIETFGYMVPRPRTLRWTDTEKVVLGRSSYAMHSSLLATGIGSALLGARADIIIADDIIGEPENMSQVRAQEASTWFWKVLLNTLEPDGQVVVLGSRWGPQDLYQEIKDRWKDLPSTMAAWQKGVPMAPGRYPPDHVIRKLENEGGLDPLAARLQLG